MVVGKPAAIVHWNPEADGGERGREGGEGGGAHEACILQFLECTLANTWVI